MITIRNLSIDNIEDALALSVDDWQRKYVRPNAEMIALAYVGPQELFPIALYAGEELVGLAFVKKEQKAAIMTLESVAGVEPLGRDPEKSDLQRVLRAARAAAHPDRRDGDRSKWDQVEQAARTLGL